MTTNHEYARMKLERVGYKKPGDGNCCCKCRYSGAQTVGQMNCAKHKLRVSKFGICPQYEPSVKTP